MVQPQGLERDVECRRDASACGLRERGFTQSPGNLGWLPAALPVFREVFLVSQLALFVSSSASPG